jgi:hypothetical protein
LNRKTVEDASGRTTLFPRTKCGFPHGKIIAGTLATPGLSTASNYVYALAGGDRERAKQKAGGRYKCNKHGRFCRGRSGFIGPGTWL